MSFREKSSWISLLSMSIIYGIYFWSVSTAAPQNRGVHFDALLTSVGLLIVVQVVLFTAAAIFSPKDASAPIDEREKLIELRSTRIAYSGLASGIVTACLLGAVYPSIVYNTNGLLFILVTVELLRSACQIIQYRRGA